MDKDTCKDNGLSGEFAGRVRSLFGKIYGRYYLSNHVLSRGVDLWWRRVLVRMSGIKAGESVLDMCCGTGDVAFAFAKYRDGLRIFPLFDTTYALYPFWMYRKTNISMDYWGSMNSTALSS